MARTPSPSSFDHPLSHSSLPNHHNPHQLIWTPAHEERLLLVQTQLSKAQKEWSEDQDLWLEEVYKLQDLKRKYKKAVKKASRRRAKKTIALWKSKANISSSPAADMGEEDASDDMSGNMSPVDDKSQEAPRFPFGVMMRRISSRRSTYTEGEASSMSHRSLELERVQSSNGIRKLLRRWSSRGTKGKESTDDADEGVTSEEK